MLSKTLRSNVEGSHLSVIGGVKTESPLLLRFSHMRPHVIRAVEASEIEFLSQQSALRQDHKWPKL